MNKIKKWTKDCYEAFKKIPGWLIALSAVATVLMNLLANKTLFSDGAYLSLDCGFLISWIMFLVMDITTQRYGGKASFALTIFDVALALGMSGLMVGIAAIPDTAVSGWFTDDASISGALNGLIGNNILVVLTSLFAFVISSAVDILSNVFFGRLFIKKSKEELLQEKPGFKRFSKYFVRAYGSTFLSQLVDNLVFQMIAYPLLFSMPCTPLSIFVGALVGAVAELLMELIFAPIGYKAVYSGKNKNGEQSISALELQTIPTEGVNDESIDNRNE